MGTHLPLSQRAQLPILGPYLLWPNGWIDSDATWYGGRPWPRRRCVTWGRSQLAPSPKTGRVPQIFAPPKKIGLCLLWPNGWMYQDGTWHVGRPQPRQHCARWDPASLPKKGDKAPLFGPCLLWPNGWTDQDATWYGGKRLRRRCVR